MGVQFEPMNPPLEQYGPWHFGDVRFQQDRCAELEAALLQTATISGLSDRLLEISKASRADCHSPARPEVTLSVSRVPKYTVQEPSRPAPSIPSPTPNRARRSLFPATADPSLAFIQPTPSGKTVVTFPLSTPQPRPCHKRRRPDTDVDGPGTSSLSCKKRRLLRHLITSRLSQPFSLPATHILNRESVTTGDKRFVKLSAIMSARRLNSAVAAPAQAPQAQQPSPSTWLRRAAVLNSLRSRVYAAAAERASAGVPVPDLAVKAAVFQQGTAFSGGRYLIGSANSPRSDAPPLSGLRSPAHTPSSHLPSIRVHTQGTPPPAPTPTNPIHIHVHVPTTTARSLRIPSPKLRPLRSPELRVTRPLVPLEDIHIPDLLDHDNNAHYNHNNHNRKHTIHTHNHNHSHHDSTHNNTIMTNTNGRDDEEEEEDDDTMAFPTSQLESRYAYDDDDDDDAEGEGGGGVGVYADFSVIFGGGGDGDDEDRDGDGDGGDEGGGYYAGSGWGGGGDHFEDYMDDLDGIPGGLGLGSGSGW